MAGILKTADGAAEGRAMSEEQQMDAAGQVLVLPAVLDLTSAETLRTSLLGVVAGDALTIDAGAVQRITSPAMQVFAAAAKQLAQQGRRLEFRNLPDGFRQIADTLALSGVLGFTEA
jgi:anti-anti-sigma regulatory factor